jgi:hypothetical protein
MSFELTVLHAFGQYAKGAYIWVKEEVEAILNSEHAHHVIKVPVGTHTAAEAAAEPAKAEGAEG